MPNRKRSVSSSSSSSSQDSRGISTITPNQTELIRAASNFTVPQLVALIQAEHNYARPLPVEKKTRSFPTRFLFQNLQEFNIPETKAKDVLHSSTKSSSKKSRSKYPSGPTIIASDENEVDVTSIDDEPPIPYDAVKAKNLMAECEKHVNFARLSDVAEDWEEKIVRTGWTKAQRKLFGKTLKLLHADHLARLTYSENPAEPLYRRLSIDKTARAFRCLLTEFNYDTKLCQWLHGQLVDHLSLNYLSAYLDILQTLKAKIPSLIDRMIVLSTTKGGVGSRHGETHLHASGVIDEKDQVNVEALNLLLKRQWDPFAPVIQANKYKKLAVTPVFVVVPSGPASIVCTHRQKNILSLLSGLGKVVSVTLNSTSANKLNLHLYCERMLNTSRNKLAEVAASFPNKPIYLVGFGSGAIVAATISQKQYLQQQKQDQNGDDNFNMDTSTSPKTSRGGKATPNIPIAGVICLAFPLYGIFGSRADIDDPFRNLSHPSLFVIGDRSTNVNVTDMELFRRKLKCENALSVICHADDFLRVTNYHQKRLHVTQSYVDKCIIDEITWFIINLPLLQEDLKTQALKEEKEKAERAAIAAGLIPPPPQTTTTTTTNLDLTNAANSNIIINSTINSQTKSFSRHAKPFYRPTNNNINNTIGTENITSNSSVNPILTSMITSNINPNVHIMNNKTNININNSSGNLNNSVQIDNNSIISTTTLPITTLASTTSTNYNVTASKLHQQSFTKRKIINSLPHPTGLRKHNIPISPLARPFPNKISKDSNSSSPFTWPSTSQDCPDDPMNETTINIPSQSSSLLLSTPSSSITTTTTSSSSSSSAIPTSIGIVLDGIPTIISSRQKALLTQPVSSSHQQHSHKGSLVPLSQQQIYNSGTGTVVTSTNSIINNNNYHSSSSSNINNQQQNITLSQNLIPGLPDTLALLTPHPISKPSNSDILRRFEEQQQQFQEHQNKQAVLEAQQKLKHQQQQTTFTTQNSPYLYRLLTPSGPTQHTTFRYTTTPAPQSTPVDRRPTRCTDETLSDIESIPNLYPLPSSSSSSSSSSSNNNIHNIHSYSAVPSSIGHGQINPELFQTLKSTLSVSNNNNNKCQGSGNNNNNNSNRMGQNNNNNPVLMRVPSSSNLTSNSNPNPNSTIETITTNAGKYTVFTSKDKRSLQKTNEVPNTISDMSSSCSNSIIDTSLLQSSTLTTTNTTFNSDPVLFGPTITATNTPTTFSLSSTASIPANAIAVILKSSNITSSSSNQAVPILVKSSGNNGNNNDGSSQPQQIILLAKPIDSSSIDPSKLISSAGLNIFTSSFPIISTSASQFPSSSTSTVSSLSQSQSFSTVYNPQGLSKSKIVVNVNQNSGNNNNDSSDMSTPTTIVKNDEEKSKDVGNEEIISTTTISSSLSSTADEKVIVATDKEPETTISEQREEKGENNSIINNKNNKIQEKEETTKKELDNKNPAPEKITLISQSSKISIKNDDGQKQKNHDQNQDQKILSTTTTTTTGSGNGNGNKSVLLESKALSLQKKVKVDDKDDRDKVKVKSQDTKNKIQVQSDKDKIEADCDDECEEGEEEEETTKFRGRRGSSSSTSSSTSSPRFSRSKDKSLHLPTRSTPRVKNPPLYSETQLRALTKFQIVEKSEKKLTTTGKSSKVQPQEKEKEKPKESDSSSNNSLKRKRESSQQPQPTSSSKNNSNNNNNNQSSSSSTSGKKTTAEMERNKATAGFEQVVERYKNRPSRSSIKPTISTTENKKKPKTRNSSNSSSPAITTTTTSTSKNNKKNSSDIELIEIESDDEQDGGRITRNRAKYGKPSRQTTTTTATTSSSISTGDKEQETDEDDEDEEDNVRTRGRRRQTSHSKEREPENKEKKTKQKDESKSNNNKTKESSGNNKEEESDDDDQTDSETEEEEDEEEEEEEEETSNSSSPEKPPKKRRRRRKQIEHLMELSSSTTVNSSRTRKSTTFYGNNIFTG